MIAVHTLASVAAEHTVRCGRPAPSQAVPPLTQFYVRPSHLKLSSRRGDRPTPSWPACPVLAGLSRPGRPVPSCPVLFRGGMHSARRFCGNYYSDTPQAVTYSAGQLCEPIKVRAYQSAGLSKCGPIKAGEGNRTLVFSLEGYCSTIELHPRLPKDQFSDRSPVFRSINGPMTNDFSFVERRRLSLRHSSLRHSSLCHLSRLVSVGGAGFEPAKA